jgi:hypothetical protein
MPAALVCYTFDLLFSEGADCALFCLIERRNLLATLLKKTLLAAGALSLRVSSAESGSNGKGNHRIVFRWVSARSEWHNDEDVLTVFDSPIVFLAIPVSVLVSIPVRVIL